MGIRCLRLLSVLLLVLVTAVVSIDNQGHVPRRDEPASHQTPQPDIGMYHYCSTRYLITDTTSCLFENIDPVVNK